MADAPSVPAPSPALWQVCVGSLSPPQDPGRDADGHGRGTCWRCGRRVRLLGGPEGPRAVLGLHFPPVADLAPGEECAG